MGWFSSLGDKISSGIHSLGQKAGAVVKKGVKWAGEHAAGIAKGAGVVSKIAGGIATGAAAIGLEPIAAGFGAVAAGAKGVQKVAEVVDTGYRAGQAGLSAVHHGADALRAARSGHFITSYKEGKQAVSEGQKAKKQIEKLRK